MQKTPNSGWGEAIKKSERTQFEMKKLVTNQATSQFNIDVDSIGVDIPNTDSYVTSQEHVSSLIHYVYAFIWFNRILFLTLVMMFNCRFMFLKIKLVSILC